MSVNEAIECTRNSRRMEGVDEDEKVEAREAVEKPVATVVAGGDAVSEGRFDRVPGTGSSMADTRTRTE